ncbi:CHAP domain-containing protein [Flavobacterium sp. LB3P45]|uniref:CHAP domain-containing protein n=1 Tax=Flavobacterium fructosi TaxID=3230416 RepID=A0ABW6HR05_9FLAO
MSPLSLKALEIAIKQLGVQEIPRGSNAGPAVEKYLKSVGLGKGYAWCEAFVYWCYSEAGKELGVVNPLKKTAGVLDQLNNSKKYVVKTPQKGDLFIMDFGGGQGHIGFVNEAEVNTIQTVEGNSNDDGSREGYEVCRKPNGRKTNTIKAFLRV